MEDMVVTVAMETMVMGAMVAIMIILMDLATMVSIRLMTVMHDQHSPKFICMNQYDKDFHVTLLFLI